MTQKGCVFLWLTWATLLAGCHHAPSIDVLGSFFPAWMLCAMLGVLLSVAMHLVFLKTKMVEHIPFRPLVYILMAGAFTFMIWLGWFAN